MVLLKILRLSLLAVFYAGVMVILGHTMLYTPRSEAHPLLLKSLLDGSDKGFLVRGWPLEMVKPFLPPRGMLSFITDKPHGEDVDATQFFHDAASFLVPIVLDSRLESERGIVFCSTDEIAQRRLAESGFRWEKRIADGKGLMIREEKAG